MINNVKGLGLLSKLFCSSEKRYDQVIEHVQSGTKHTLEKDKNKVIQS